MAITYHAGRRIQGLSTDRTQGLKTYYHFEDNGTNAQTTNLGLGSSADMTVTGATYVTGKVGSKAISFDGTNDYAVIGSSTSDFNFLANTTHEWTVAFWLKNDDFSSLGMILSTSVELGSSRYGLGIRAQSSGSMYVHFSNGTNTNRFTTTQTGFSTDGNWHFIVITAKKSDSTNSLEFWQDGTSLGTASNSGKDFVDTNASQAPYIGQAGDSSQYLDGALDELSIWNRRLSDSEIATLYNSGTGIVIGSTDISVGDPLSNTQVGSRYEETNTRKMYNYTESDTISSTPASWGDFSSTTGSQQIGVGSTYKISAQKIHNSSSNLNGKTIGKIGLALRLISGTGTATAGVFNSSGAILHTFGTIDISTLSTGYSPYTWYDFTGTSLYTLAVGEYVGIKMTSGSGSMGVAHRDSGTQYDGGNSYWDRWNGSSWSGSFTSLDLSIKLYVGTTGGTFTWQEIGT